MTFFNFILTTYNYIFFADDTAIILSADSGIELQSLMDAFFLKYTLWCILNCIVTYLAKPNFLLFNLSTITVNSNGYFLDNPKVVKYFGEYINDKLR